MNSRGAIIAGLGTVSAAGGSVEETLVTFAALRCNAGPVTLFDTPLRNPVFEVRRPVAAGRSRTVELALLALREALAQAHLETFPADLRVGVCLGTTVACQLNDFPFYAAFRAGQPVSLDAVDRYLKGNLAQAVAHAAGARGPAVTIVNACSSGTDALGIALQWIRADQCDVVIAGGADELNRVPMCGFHALGVMSPDLCRPFDRDRQGLNLGEGAGILILEAPASALRRGTAADLFVAGFGAACDAHHLTAPRPDGAGLEKAVRNALCDARVAEDAIGFVNAHGTATRDNDLAESGVLARVFGHGVRVLSTKGFTGHTLGAAGGMEAVFTAAALREGWIPASAGFATRDEALALAPVRERTAISASYALSTSLAFGGNNAAVVIGRQSDGRPRC